ncbi:MAG TPA: hypothetical protein VLJ18_05770 [Thermoanaerobaculia bacterium]|nr:hypothetical protein [Thermoanaerobaculia bacterium]
MKFSLRLLSLVAAGAVAVGSAFPAGAESGRLPNALVGSSYVFPSVANTQGLFGAFFKTKVTLYNPNSFDIVVEVQLTTAAGAPPTQTIALAAGGFRRWDNFLQDVFGFTGGGGLVFTEGSSKVFIAVVEVYVDGPNGRYTTPVTGLLPDDAILPSSLAPGAIFVAPGIQNNAGNRANFGCLSLAPIASSVRVDFHAFTNGARTTASSTLNLQAVAWQQVPVPIAGDDIIAVFGLTTDDPSLIAYCYAVNVNNASNDGNSIVARRSPPK